MKRFFRLLLCASLVLCLASCDTWWGLLVAGITGKGYYQVSRSSVTAVSASLKNTSIALTSLTTSSVIVYQTHDAVPHYGKLALTTALTSTSMSFQYVTFADDGSTLKGSNGTSVSSGSGFDLENDTATGSTAASADFSFDGTSLIPKNNATFYLYPPQ
jgi:hypothetical protein